MIAFKIHRLAAAQGPHFRCEGRVTLAKAHHRHGAGTYAVDIRQEKRCATMQCTLMAVQGRAGTVGK